MLNATANIDGTQWQIEVPDKCPMCHRLATMNRRSAHKLPNNEGAEVLYQCSVADCMHYFIVTYGKPAEKKILHIVPQRSSPTEFPEFIKEVSPSFLSIYEEAEQATVHGLDQISGPGFRKAFEFLIKDYAIKENPSEAEKIKKSFAANVVSDYIGDPRIQAAAKRALWLGNDETHYLRKWDAHDIEDLKTLVKLAVNWMEIEQLSRKYAEEIPDGS